MPILYLLKADPFASLGHAAERSREFLNEWKKLNFEVATAWPGGKFQNTPPHWILDRTKSPFERLLGVPYSHHFRQLGTRAVGNLKEIMEENQFNQIVCEELTMAHLAIKAGFSSKTIYVAHNVEALLAKQIGKPKNFLEHMRLSHLEKTELEVIQSARAVFAFSPLDQKRLIERSGRTDILSTRAGCLMKKDLSESSGDRILFVGALDYAPNIEALNWFVREILPLTRLHKHITVAGRSPSAQIIELCRASGLELIASPQSMAPILARGCVSIVPLLSGSGTRGKILESAAQGIPVLSTTLGAEGLEFPSQAIQLADQPQDFAKKLDELFRNESLRKDMRLAARAFVEKFSYSEVVADFTRELSNFR